MSPLPGTDELINGRIIDPRGATAANLGDAPSNLATWGPDQLKAQVQPNEIIKDMRPSLNRFFDLFPVVETPEIVAAGSIVRRRIGGNTTRRRIIDAFPFAVVPVDEENEVTSEIIRRVRARDDEFYDQPQRVWYSLVMPRKYPGVKKLNTLLSFSLI